MSEKLKQCPFCKGEFAFDFEAKNFRCGTCGATVPPDPYARTVNTRPIEDELTARIAELEAENDELKERVAMLDVTAVYKSLGEMGYIEQVDRLNARIAELEEKQRWIPVSERLPEEDTDGNALMVIHRYSGEWARAPFGIEFADEFVRHYSHWMFAPELPEVQG